MWRFTQQRNDTGERLNVYHVEEVGKKTSDVVGVFVFMNPLHNEAGKLSELIELYTSDEMDSEFEEGRQEGYKEADSPSSPQSEASPPLGELPLNESPLSVVL